MENLNLIIPQEEIVNEEDSSIVENKVVELAKNINTFINENFSAFNLRLNESDIRLKFEEVFYEENQSPLITVGSSIKSRTNIRHSDATNTFNKLIEQFGFEEKIVSVNATPNSMVKMENKIFQHNSDPKFLLSLNYTEESVDINLEYNKFFPSNLNTPINESVEVNEDLAIFIENEILMESFIKNNRYAKKLEEYERMFSLSNQKVTSMNLLKTFDPKLVKRIEERFCRINSEDYYTTYRNTYEHDMLMRYFNKLYNRVKEDKSNKGIFFVFSILMHKGQCYPLLIAANVEMQRVIGVYGFVMKPDEKGNGYYISLVELYHSYLDALKNDILRLRKNLACSYFQ